MTGGQEVVGRATADVEAERAAAATAVDRVATGDGGAQLARYRLEGGPVTELGDDRLDGVELRAGDGAVRGDHDLVADRVQAEGRAGGLELRLQGGVRGGEHGAAVRDVAGGRAGHGHRLGGRGVGHVDDDLAGRVDEGACGRRAELGVQLAGEGGGGE